MWSWFLIGLIATLVTRVKWLLNDMQIKFIFDLKLIFFIFGILVVKSFLRFFLENLLGNKALRHFNNSAIAWSLHNHACVVRVRLNLIDLRRKRQKLNWRLQSCRRRWIGRGFLKDNLRFLWFLHLNFDIWALLPQYSADSCLLDRGYPRVVLRYLITFALVCIRLYDTQLVQFALYLQFPR